MPAGYSGTPLAKKIGIKPGMTVVVSRAPDTLERDLGTLPDGARLTSRAGKSVECAIVFVTRFNDLSKKMSSFAQRMEDTGMIWIAWPKKSSGVPSDLDFSIVQKCGLSNKLVDTKVCAIDETWSGLKFMRRRKDRKKK